MTLSRKVRSGFTLIELMVAMTLTLFVMLILTQAFVTSLDVFDGLKGIGDMEGHLRTVATNLRHDLSQDHFEGKRRSSDPDFWTNRVKEGFFYVRQFGPSYKEPDNSASAADIGQIPSYASWIPGAASPSYHVLYFTSKLRGNQQEKFYSAKPDEKQVPSPLLTKPTNFFDQKGDALFQETGQFRSQWAEIAYFTVPTGTTVDISDSSLSSGGTPLRSLYRAEYLLVPNTSDVNNPSNQTDAPAGFNPIDFNANVSCLLSGAKVLFNSPADVRDINKRSLDTTTSVPKRRDSSRAPREPEFGSTLLLTNVISFNVRVLGYVESASGGLSSDFSDIPGGEFDSASTTSPGYRLHALEITIRIWDQKTEQARQITIVQSL